MGCPKSAKLDENLSFSVVTHDADTGAITDADAVPVYRIYEDDTDAAILTGDMVRFDAGNTTGFYLKKVTVSAASGFELGRTYTIYVEAEVDGDKGGILFSFRVANDIVKKWGITGLYAGIPADLRGADERACTLYGADDRALNLRRVN